MWYVVMRSTTRLHAITCIGHPFFVFWGNGAEGDANRAAIELNLADWQWPLADWQWLGGSGAGLDLGGSGFGFDLGDSGSAIGLDLGGSGAASGIGAAFEGGEDDDLAETRVADALDEELSLEAVGSGSGLLDLTNESDDTSLGAELLDAVWQGDDTGNFDGDASGLFETSEQEQEQIATVAADAPMGLPVAMAEVYDGKWSGTGVGLLLGSLVALLAVSVMLVTSIMGVSPKLANMVTGDVMMWGGGFLGFAIVAGLVGMFIGKASE